MLWHWRYKNLKDYATKAGAYANLNTGLAQLQMDAFYTRLGLRALKDAKRKNLRWALGWTPVIFTGIDEVTGHAIVLAGFSGTQYKVVNPCATRSIDFEKNLDVCAAGTLTRAPAQVEERLGSFIWYW